MSQTKYWHMQMHPDDITYGKECVHSILQQHNIIGMGDWKKGQQEIQQFKNDMQVNDIVAIKNGKQFVALAQIIGGYYEVDEESSKIEGWKIIHRRPVRVLDWEIDDKKLRQCPQPMGTLNPCCSKDAETTKVIKEWHEAVIKSFKKRCVNLTV